MTGRRGWVPITPDGLVLWTFAMYRRRSTQELVAKKFSMLSSLSWRDMYRMGWRVVRCQVED